MAVGRCCIASCRLNAGRRRGRSGCARRAGGGGMSRLLPCFGFSAQALAERLADKGCQSPAARDPRNVAQLDVCGYACVFSDLVKWNGVKWKTLPRHDDLLAPLSGKRGRSRACTLPRRARRALLARMDRLPLHRWDMDQDGKHRSTRAPSPEEPNTARTEARVEVERAWLAFGEETGVSLHLRWPAFTVRGAAIRQAA